MKQQKRRGPKSKYQHKFAAQAVKLCMLGATDQEMADFFEVSEKTINTWKKEYPEFSEALKKGKIEADAHVASKLFQRATGFEVTEHKVTTERGTTTQEVQTTKQYPPDTAAAIHWLKNRRSATWRDQKDINYTDTSVESFLQMTAEERAEKISELRQKLKMNES